MFKIVRTLSLVPICFCILFCFNFLQLYDLIDFIKLIFIPVMGSLF